MVSHIDIVKTINHFVDGRFYFEKIILTEFTQVPRNQLERKLEDLL